MVCDTSGRRVICHLVKNFTQTRGSDPEVKNSYTVCEKTFKRPQDLKTHRTKTKHYDDVQDKISPAAERKSMEVKKKKYSPRCRPAVKWGNKSADNCCHFEYLGVIVQVDGKQMSDVRRRVVMVRQRHHGKMWNVWASSKIHLRLKLCLLSVCCGCVIGDDIRIGDGPFGS